LYVDEYPWAKHDDLLEIAKHSYDKSMFKTTAKRKAELAYFVMKKFKQLVVENHGKDAWKDAWK
jgi:hypothetical protein